MALGVSTGKRVGKTCCDLWKSVEATNYREKPNVYATRECRSHAPVKCRRQIGVSFWILRRSRIPQLRCATHLVPHVASGVADLFRHAILVHLKNGTSKWGERKTRRLEATFQHFTSKTGFDETHLRAAHRCNRKLTRRQIS